MRSVERGTAPQFSVRPSQPIFLQISEQLVAAIQAGHYPVGSSLPGELELARLFGASRPSVREALSALQFAGYIEGQRGRGTVIRATEPRGSASRGPETLDEVIDLLEVRALIEPPAVRQAARHIGATARRELQTTVSGMELALDQPELRVRTDLSLHIALVRACPNRVLAAEAERLLNGHEGVVWQRIRTETWSGREEPKHWLEHHQQLLAAVTERQPELAATLCRAHLASVVRTVERVATTTAQRARLRELAGALESEQLVV